MKTTATKATKSAKSTKAIKAPKAVKKTSTPRESTLGYTFVKALAEEPAEDTTYGCVYAAIKKLKKGSLQDVQDAAIKCGLTKASSQDPRTMTRVMLRQLHNLGAVKAHRGTNGDEAPVAKKAKKVGAVKSGKGFKLVKQ